MKPQHKTDTELLLNKSDNLFESVSNGKEVEKRNISMYLRLQALAINLAPDKIGELTEDTCLLRATRGRKIENPPSTPVAQMTDTELLKCFTTSPRVEVQILKEMSKRKFSLQTRLEAALERLQTIPKLREL